jgi:tRNA U34 2-thiouridine synthase MnmA/TrmU
MKAITLISGGLDSLLAAKLVREQGIEIIPLNFKIPFCHRDKELATEKPTNLKQAADNLEMDLKTVDISSDFLKMLENPKYGFGANMNPCIDCKILMLSKTKELMEELDAAFVVTGEVLGQRPMSQHRQALEIIEKKSGLLGLILRPLSAKLLTMTIPEKEGWVDRNKLLDFSGRQRRPQMELAKDFQIENYPNASGGCLLTDPEFAKRLKELISHQELGITNIRLLKIGRHFRISEKTKLVVGRNEKEDKELENLAEAGDYLFFPDEELAGPTSLGRGRFNTDLIKIACNITCRYCDLNGKTEAEITYRKIPEKEDNILKVSSITDNELAVFRI